VTDEGNEEAAQAQLGAFDSAGTLYAIARSAFDRTGDAITDTEPGQQDALIAVVFAAASVEAFINEAAMLAGLRFRPGLTDPPSVARFKDLLDEAEVSHASTRLKYLLAGSVLLDQAYEKGRQPYQNFDLLLKVRDEVIHLKGERFRMVNGNIVLTERKNIIRALGSRHLVDVGANTGFTNLISTRAVARWACNSAAHMVRSVRDGAPSGQFKTTLRFGARITFQEIP
jgi:hypothetical protein